MDARPCLAPECAQALNIGLNNWSLVFISLSINESTLPDRQAQGADEVYSDGGARTKQKSGIISAFGFVKQQREEMMPSLAKKV